MSEVRKFFAMIDPRDEDDFVVLGMDVAEYRLLAREYLYFMSLMKIPAITFEARTVDGDIAEITVSSYSYNKFRQALVWGGIEGLCEKD